jgi:hypothetical protein
MKIVTTRFSFLDLSPLKSFHNLARDMKQYSSVCTHCIHRRFDMDTPHAQNFPNDVVVVGRLSFDRSFFFLVPRVTNHM